MQERSYEELVGEWQAVRLRGRLPVWVVAVLGAASVALTGLAWVWLVVPA